MGRLAFAAERALWTYRTTATISSRPSWKTNPEPPLRQGSGFNRGVSRNQPISRIRFSDRVVSDPDAEPVSTSSWMLMVEDLAGLPLLMSAPCPHCEQVSTRGSDAAVAPTWRQWGQAIRVSMNDTYRQRWRDYKHECQRQEFFRATLAAGHARPPCGAFLLGE